MLPLALAEAQQQPSIENYLRAKSLNEAFVPINQVALKNILADKAIKLDDGSIKIPYRLENGRPIFLEELMFNQLRDLSFSIGTQADQLWPGGSSGYNVTGSGITLGIWEGGWPNNEHVTFVDPIGTQRITLMDTTNADTHPVGFSNHAMDVTSIVTSEGDPSPDLQSLAYESSIWSFDIQTDPTKGEIEAAVTSGLIASNHSYGDITGWTGYRLDPDGDGPEPGRYRWFGNPAVDETEDYHFGFYNDNSAFYDSLIYRNKFYSMVAAVGNDRGTGVLTDTHYVFTGVGPFEGGWELSTTPRQADNDWLGGFDTVLPGMQSGKNVISVGSLTNDDAIACRVRNEVPYTTAYYSDWGPTDDGRIKPDFSAPAMAFYRPVPLPITGFNCAGAAGGTSYAAPVIVGGLGLLAHHQEILSTGVMRRASTYKALLAQTALDRNRPGPDYSTGWGMPQFRDAADIMKHDSDAGGDNRIFEKTLTEGSSDIISVVSDGGPLRATMAWTDPPGTSLETSDGSPDPTWLDNTTPLLVNDLDLAIIDPSLGPDYFFPWKLDPGSPLTNATRPSSSTDDLANTNIVDIMEQVLIDNPVAGRTYQIRVKHKGSLTNPLSGGTIQDYSLIFSGGKIVRMSADLKVMMSGPYDTGAMTSTLNSSGILQTHATKNPYTSAPWNFVGEDSVGTGFFSSQPSVVDWVMVRLLSGNPASPPMTLVDENVGLLLTDGSIRASNGTSLLGFSATPGSYHVSVSHRNHLAVLSSTAIDFSSGSAAYDFTDALSKAFTAGGLAMRDMLDGKYALWAADGIKDEEITSFDYLNSWLPANGSAAGYLQADFNMDGSVTAFDFLNAWLPSNGQASQVP